MSDLILREKLDLTLFNNGAIKFGAFKLKLHEKNPDAPLSPIYLNLRNLSEPTYELIGTVLDSLASREGFSYDYIIGIPKAGEPIGQAMGKVARKPCLRMEKIETVVGRKITSKILDPFTPGSSVLLVDDLITQADTKREAYNGVVANDLKVAGILVVYDREQGGLTQLREEGIKIAAARTMTEMLNFYVSVGSINSGKKDEVIAYQQLNR